MITFASDDTVAVPLVFKDTEGHTIAGNPLAAHITVSVSDTTNMTASLTTDGQWVSLSPMGIASSALRARHGDLYRYRRQSVRELGLHLHGAKPRERGLQRGRRRHDAKPDAARRRVRSRLLPRATRQVQRYAEKADPNLRSNPFHW